MKTKIIGLLLTVALTLGLLSSCVFITEFPFPTGSAEGNDDNLKDTIINVTGGDEYNVTINSNGNQNMLAASKALLSVVSVTTSSSAGSGVIYQLDKEKGDAYIITNYHVLYQNKTASISDKINVYLYGMEAAEYAIPATYVGGSMNYDLAVIRVRTNTTLMGSNAMAATIADSDKVAILDTAIAIGNPEAEGISATTGCINVDSENIIVEFQSLSASKQVQLRVMRTDAAVNSGNSGGGLFNDKGELIGIVNAKNASSTTDNIGYAIPSNVAKAIAQNIIDYCAETNKTSVYRCMLGITVSVKSLSTKYDTESGKIFKLEEVFVSELTDNSSVAGKIYKNDVINSISINGEKTAVTRTFHVVDTMLNARVNDTVIINVTRNGASVDVTIPIVESMLTQY